MFGGHCNLSKVKGVCLFCTLNCIESHFFDVFVELLFLCFLVFTKICFVSSSYKYSTSSPYIEESYQFKIQNKTVENWRFLTNLQKKAYHTVLSPFQMSNWIAKFNSWKFIVARWILHQLSLTQSQGIFSIYLCSSIWCRNKTQFCS